MHNGKDQYCSRVPLDDEFAVDTEFSIELPEPWPQAKTVFVGSDSAKFNMPPFSFFNTSAPQNFFTPSTLYMDFEGLLIKENHVTADDVAWEPEEAIFLSWPPAAERSPKMEFPSAATAETSPRDQGGEELQNVTSGASTAVVGERLQDQILKTQFMDKENLQKTFASLLQSKICISFSAAQKLSVNELRHPLTHKKAESIHPLVLFSPPTTAESELVLLKLLKKISSQKTSIGSVCKLGIRDTRERTLSVFVPRRRDGTGNVHDKAKELEILQNKDGFKPLLCFRDICGRGFALTLLQSSFTARKEISIVTAETIQVDVRDVPRGSSDPANLSDEEEYSSDNESVDSLDKMLE